MDTLTLSDCCSRLVRASTRPLHIASTACHLTVVRSLLDAEANLNAHDKDGHAPLEYACVQGHLGVIKTLLDADANSGERQSRVVEKALLTAVRSRRLDVVKLLLVREANPNFQIASSRNTPQHGPVGSDGVSAAQARLDAGADRQLATAAGESPDEWTHRATLLDVACGIGSTGIVQLLVRAGADVNAVTSDIDSPLLIACASHRVETVRELVRAGADATHLGSDGYSPLHVAASHGRDDLV